MFQRSAGLLVDGVAGPQTLAALGLDAGEPVEPVGMTVEIASSMLPAAPLGRIEDHLPVVLAALASAGIADKPMTFMALATIRAETAAFVPISEGMSRFNTSPGGRPFDLYDHRRDLGNLGPPDGERFKGRGFVQLTGRVNYRKHGSAIGLGGTAGGGPRGGERRRDGGGTAGAGFLKARERSPKEALLERDFRHARRLINGSGHGGGDFTDAYQTGEQLLG